MKKTIQTSLLNRQVIVDWPCDVNPETGERPCMPLKDRDHGGESGEIVNVYMEGGTIKYTVCLTSGRLVELWGCSISVVMKEEDSC